MTYLVEGTIQTVQVKVATPPVDTSNDEDIPNETVQPIFYYHYEPFPITNEEVKQLKARTATGELLRKTVIRNYQQSYALESTEGAPSATIPSENSTIHPESMSDYFTNHLSGIRKAVIGGIANSYNNLPSGVMIPSAGCVISTPYYPMDPKYLRNGVQNNSKTLNPAETPYLWQSEEVIRDARTGRSVNVLQPRPDGAVEMTPQPRGAKNPRETIKLRPALYESSLGINAGKAVNSFTLQLGIVPGCEDAQNSPKPWRIRIVFGEVMVLMEEGRGELEITFQGKDPQRYMIAIGANQITTSGFGSRPYALTFIPVWNGLLISDAPPGSSNFAERVVYFSKSINRSPVEEMNKIFYPESEKDRPKKDPKVLPKLKTGLNFGLNFKAKDAPEGIEIKDDDETRVITGESINITYLRCGGMIKYIPVYFTDAMRIHYIDRGSQQVSSKDIKTLVSGSPPITTTQPVNSTNIPEDVMELTKDKDETILPVFYYKNAPFYRVNARKAVLPFNDNTPYSDTVVEYRREKPDYKAPIQTWGFLKFRTDPVIKFRNDDGFLNNNDVPQSKIKAISVQRSLDGSSGSITWDRFDPVTGVTLRPPQNSGGIRIAALGGRDTIPGVIFTGMAIGNAEDNTVQSNDINVPLHGREYKITEEGGLKLLNVPYFDGYDHREVMQFLCNYGGIPFKSNATPYRLPASYNIGAPVVDFVAGTPVWGAMGEIAKMASTLFYFDRFGVLQYYDVQTVRGKNWEYPDNAVENYNDEPDYSSIRNRVVLSALIAEHLPQKLESTIADPLQIAAPVIMKLDLDTNPEFAWDKMMFYVINGVLPTQAEFNRVALRIAKGVSRPRAAGKVTIPGNAEIELLDTFNTNWVVTQISQNIDLQAKSWHTSLGLELIADTPLSGEVTILPIESLS